MCDVGWVVVEEEEEVVVVVLLLLLVVVVVRHWCWVMAVAMTVAVVPSLQVPF